MSRYLFANSSNGQRIHINNAERGAKGYTCPFCGSPMTAKKGSVKAHHFAHSPDYKCDEWYGNKGEWHLEMQNLFPKECQEVILSVDGEKHIADVCINKPCGQRLIVEFQDSPLSQDEFKKRTKFWKSNGSDVIWVFNLLDKDIKEVPDSRVGGNYTYNWKRPFSTLGNNMVPGVTVFFYINPIINTGFRYSETYGERWMVYGKHRIEPIFLNLTRVGTYIPDAIDDRGHYFEYKVSGYSGFTGVKCYDFVQFIKDRVNIKFDDPEEGYRGDIWIRYDDEKALYKDKFVRHLESLTYKHKLHEFKAFVFMRNNHHTYNITIYYADRRKLVEKLKSIHGNNNVMVLDEDGAMKPPELWELENYSPSELWIAFKTNDEFKKKESFIKECIRKHEEDGSIGHIFIYLRDTKVRFTRTDYISEGTAKELAAVFGEKNIVYKPSRYSQAPTSIQQTNESSA